MRVASNQTHDCSISSDSMLKTPRMESWISCLSAYVVLSGCTTMFQGVPKSLTAVAPLTMQIKFVAHQKKSAHYGFVDRSGFLQYRKTCLRIQRCTRTRLSPQGLYGELHDGLFVRCKRILVSSVRCQRILVSRVPWHTTSGWATSCHQRLSSLAPRRNSDLTSWSWQACQQSPSSLVMLCSSSLVKLCMTSAITATPSSAMRRALRVSQSRAVATGRSQPEPLASCQPVWCRIHFFFQPLWRQVRSCSATHRRCAPASLDVRHGSTTSGCATALFNDRVMDIQLCNRPPRHVARCQASGPVRASAEMHSWRWFRRS